eukprot:88176_1
MASVHSLQSQGSQFEMDCVQDTGDRILQSIRRQGSICTIDSAIDVYEQLMDVSEKDVMKTLSTQNIVFDSLLKVQSTTLQGYVDVAGVLTENALYLTSAHNYQIWIDFKDRSKIMKLVPNWQDYVITKPIAIQIVRNLDIVDDDQTNEDRIVPYFIGKTAHEILLNIMFYEDPMENLVCLFGLKNNESIKSVNCVRITNIDAMQTSMVGGFTSFVFENVQWVDQQVKNNAVTISLQRYHTPSIINQLNERKHLFCIQNDIPHTSIGISAFTKYKSIIGHVPSKVVEFNLVDDCPNYSVEPLDSRDIPYGFILKLRQSPHTEAPPALLCKLQSNNCRYEWVSHLDYVLYKLVGNGPDNSVSDHSKPSNINDKMMHDFGYKDNHTGDECTTHFNFGIYLHYWRSGYENSVTPVYPTLKNELLNNIYSPITTSDYYDLYEESYKILQGNVIRAQDIGINNKKFRIHPGSLITINHMIVLKVYTDCSQIQKEFKKHCRKQNQNESLQSVINRNCEIAHWCRYLKECCTFFGKTMPKHMVVYTGLNEKLLFNSMMQHFECPLSTTTDWNVANGFSHGKGIVLKLKRANAKTRFFNVSWLSCHKNEAEKLFMGSSLEIIDIYIQNYW